MEFFGADSDSPGQLVSQVLPPADYPISPDLRRHLTSIRWRRVEKFLGGRAVAYDFPSRHRQGNLYVVQSHVVGLAGLSVRQPIKHRRQFGRRLGVGRPALCVSFVQGDARDLHADYIGRRPLT